ncbi:MAG: ABC transporter permease [Bacteroidota bacterium]
MFKHLFKLIWNKKKQNFLLICEMLISFMVMFAVFTMIVNYYQNYKKPMGFKYNDVWVINFNNAHVFHNTDSMTLYYETVRNVLKSMPQIKEVSFAASNIPFANSTSTTGFTYKNKKYNYINRYHAGDDYHKVFDMQVLEGRWFDQQDAATAYKSIVINASFKEMMFGKGKAVGQLIGDDEDKKAKKMRVIGVVTDMKDKGDYKPSGTAIFSRVDTGMMHYIGQIVIKVAPNSGAAFEGQVYKAMTTTMKEASIEIEHLTQKRDSMNKETLIPIIILLIIAGFLIINVALGLFGVLWYNINKRRGEIGLRRAIGASGSAVAGQIVTESMFLATLSLIIGAFFAVQFPILHVFDLAASVYITAIILAIIFIYLLVLACSFYPGRQAAAVYPAVALHEE